jgi:hypothetical protein
MIPANIFPLELRGRGLAVLRVARTDEDREPLAAQAARDFLADPLVGAGDQGDFLGSCGHSRFSF